MKLLLTSAGLTNQTIANALLELAEKPFKELKLAFIPTAANVEEGDKDWLIDDLVNCKKWKFASIDIVDISAIPREMWEKRLTKADILVFGGGNIFHLMYWLEKSGLKELLPEMLKTKVYVGISAGSMVTSPKLMPLLEDLYYPNGVGKNKDEGGMRFIDFQILSHFNSPWYPNIRAEYLEEKIKGVSDVIYALDDNSAIQINDDTIKVVSEGEWKRFN